MAEENKPKRAYSLALFIILLILCWPVGLIYYVIANKQEVKEDLKEIAKPDSGKVIDETNDNIEKIARLKKLLDDGAITKTEFEEQKKKLL